MNFQRTIKQTKMHWQQRQSNVFVRFENKREEIDMKTLVKGKER